MFQFLCIVILQSQRNVIHPRYMTCRVGDYNHKQLCAPMQIITQEMPSLKFIENGQYMSLLYAHFHSNDPFGFIVKNLQFNSIAPVSFSDYHQTSTVCFFNPTSMALSCYCIDTCAFTRIYNSTSPGFCYQIKQYKPFFQLTYNTEKLRF